MVYANFEILIYTVKAQTSTHIIITILMLRMMGKKFSRRHFDIFLFFFNRYRHFMQIVS